MSNRRARRTQAKTNPTIPITTTNAFDIPLSHPNASIPKPAKTLFELAEERRLQLQPNTQPFNLSPSTSTTTTNNNNNNNNVTHIKINPNGTITPSNPSNPSDPPLPPIYDTLFLSTSLSALHFTLSTLTMHQYAESLTFPPLIKSTFLIAFPTLTFIIHLSHGHLIPFPPSFTTWYTTQASEKQQALLYGLRQLLLLVLANVAGAYLIYLCNDRGYYAVMKNAPSIGTLWVWCVLELGLLGAVLGVLGPAAWARLKGYTIF